MNDSPIITILPRHMRALKGSSGLRKLNFKVDFKRYHEFCLVNFAWSALYAKETFRHIYSRPSLHVHLFHFYSSALTLFFLPLSSSAHPTSIQPYYFFRTELPLNESRNQAERKTRILYQSCMDKDGHIEKLGFTPIYPLFKQIGGWSISTVGGVKFENSSDWKLQDLLERLSHHHPFFLLTKSPNPIKSQEHMLKVCGGGVDLCLPLSLSTAPQFT